MVKSSVQLESAIDDFTDWLEEQGADLSAVQVLDVNGVPGLYARHTIHPEENIIHVPRRAIISLPVAKADPLTQHVLGYDIQMSDHSWMAMFLAICKRTQHFFWRPFINMLPREKLSDLPVFFSRSELRMLRGSLLETLVREQQQLWAEDYKQVNFKLFGAERISYEDYIWARSIVSMRAKTVRLDGADTCAIVPGVDIMSHSFLAMSRGHDGDDISREGIRRTALTTIEANEAIYENYGPKSNALMFMFHGLCIEDNPYDETEVVMESVAKDHPFHTELQKLGEMRGHENVFKLPTLPEHQDTARLLSYARLANQADIPAVRKALADGASIEAFPAVSRDNELAALTLLINAYKQRLSQFKTSISDDSEILKDAQLPYRQQCAVKIRMAEKNILQRHLNIADAAVPLLMAKSDKLIQAVAQNCKPDGVFSPYFKQLMDQMCPTKQRVVINTQLKTATQS